MDIFSRLPKIKQNADYLVFPLLAIAYLSYFPASSAQEGDIAYLYSLLPVIGDLANVIAAFVVAFISYAGLFSIVNYLESYHSIPMFFLTGCFLLIVALAPFFGINEFKWVNTPLSYALSAVSMSFFLVLERSQKTVGSTT
ncbi:hypothetical protein HYO55_22110 [Vibrio parahaemolyticus]|nr:hypothetical protein [Vibrio parahaemolyticus]